MTSLINTLLLIDGAAGTGKTDMLDYLERRYRGKVAIIPKKTTRDLRPEEKKRNSVLDLDFVSKEDFKKSSRDAHFYQYEYGGWHYGFSKSQIARSVEENDITVVIVRNISLIKKLKEDFSWARVVVAYVHSDPARVRERLMKEGYSQEYIKLRVSRDVIAWEDYLKNPDLYDRILLNNSARVDFERLIDNLIEAAGEEAIDELIVDGKNSFPLPPSLVGRKAAMVQRLKKTNYARNVFLMMKFRPENEKTWLFIRETLAARGFNCVRADQNEWNITKDVYNPIAVLFCCKYGIALFDEPEEGAYYNPNVAYELGMMHYQKKECLILRHQALPGPPFDLIKNLHKTYSRDIELRSAVQEWLDEIAHD